MWYGFCMKICNLIRTSLILSTVAKTQKLHQLWQKVPGSHREQFLLFFTSIHIQMRWWPFQGDATIHASNEGIHISQIMWRIPHQTLVEGTKFSQQKVIKYSQFRQTDSIIYICLSPSVSSRRPAFAWRSHDWQVHPGMRRVRSLGLLLDACAHVARATAI